jgi:hypothetical protein
VAILPICHRVTFLSKALIIDPLMLKMYSNRGKAFWGRSSAG